MKKIIKEIFFNNIGLTCNFAELIRMKFAVTHRLFEGYPARTCGDSSYSIDLLAVFCQFLCNRIGKVLGYDQDKTDAHIEHPERRPV